MRTCFQRLINKNFIKCFLILLILLFNCCEDIPEPDSSVTIIGHSVRTNKYTGDRSVDLKYYLINEGETTIIGWNITFAVYYSDHEISYVGHTANPFHREAFHLEPGDTSKIIRLIRDIERKEVTDVKYNGIFLR